MLLWHPSLLPPLRNWGAGGWRLQLPPFCPSCQDVDIWKEKSGGGQIGVWSREDRRSLRKEGPGEGWVQKREAG